MSVSAADVRDLARAGVTVDAALPALEAGASVPFILELKEYHASTYRGLAADQEFASVVLRPLPGLLAAGVPEQTLRLLVGFDRRLTDVYEAHAHAPDLGYAECARVVALGTPLAPSLFLVSIGEDPLEFRDAGLRWADWFDVRYLVEKVGLRPADVRDLAGRVPLSTLRNVSQVLAERDSSWVRWATAVLSLEGEPLRVCVDAARQAEGQPWREVMLTLAREGMGVEDAVVAACALEEDAAPA